jgi:hypothetical protein
LTVGKVCFRARSLVVGGANGSADDDEAVKGSAETSEMTDIELRNAEIPRATCGVDA